MDNILDSIANNMNIKHLYIFSLVQDPDNPVVLRKLLRELSECYNLSGKCVGVNHNRKLMTFIVNNLDLYLNILRQVDDSITVNEYFKFSTNPLTEIAASLNAVSNIMDLNSSINKYHFNGSTKDQLLTSFRKMQNIFERIDKSAFSNYIHSYHWHMKSINTKNFLHDSHPFFKGILLICKNKDSIINSNRNFIIKNVYTNPHKLHKSYASNIIFTEYRNSVYIHKSDSSIELLNNVYKPHGTFSSCYIAMIKKLYGNVTYDVIETMGM